MALSDLAVFNEYAYLSMTEVIRQQIDLFNAASRNTIVLRSTAHQGDYNEEAFFGKIAGLVRRRNAYGSGAVTPKSLVHKVDTMVKVAAGTPPIQMDPGQFKWLQLNPQIAGAAMGKQLAGDMLADMLNVGIMAGYSALSGVPAVVYDGTGDTPDTMTPKMLLKGASKFGDASGDIACWIVHSGPMHDYFANNLDNGQGLFTYGTVNVIADPFGRVFVVTDSPSLVTAGTPNVYHNLGLVPDAIRIDQNNDYTENFETKNGDENIARTFQAEWSYNVGVKGFAWDKTNGGHSPTTAALGTATNWDRYSTSEKDLAGVVVNSN